MARRDAVRQDPPLQFRPGPELDGQLACFARKHGISVNLATKHLAALAVNGMDQRFYPLVARLAGTIEGRDAFPTACALIWNALAEVEEQKGRAVELDPERASIVLKFAKNEVARAGGTTEGLELEAAETPKNSFGARLRAVMADKDVTQVELAAKLGIRQSAVSMMLGRSCRPQRGTIEKIAKALDVPADELWPWR